MLAIAVVCASASEGQAPSISIQSLPVGEHFRPTNSDVSGFPGTTAPYRRSPCPALNTLANHGYLPRDGQNITRAMLEHGITSVYNIGSNFAELLVSQVHEALSLDYLSTHDLIEHDASLVHADAYYGNDPSLADPALAADFFGRADQRGFLGLQEVSAARKHRTARCLEGNPSCNTGLKAQGVAQGESALLLLALGGGNGETISRQHLESFLVQEKIPNDYVKPAASVTSLEILATTGKLTALSVF